MNKLRAGVIGLGMGRGHSLEYHKHPRVDLAALADPDAGRLRSLADELGVEKRYGTAEEMLSREELDLVSVATPNNTHKPLTIAALKAGCHVLCEKPMAMNAAEAEEMLAAAGQTGRRLMINFSSRFNPQAGAMKREADAGTLGEIYFARSVWQRRRGIPGLGGWFGQKALAGGGPLIDLGVHRLDLALWLMGYPKPVWVLAATHEAIGSEMARREGKSFDVEDLAVALVRFENGATLALEASWAGNIRENDLMETRLMGTRGGMLQTNRNEDYAFDLELFVERNGIQYDCTPHPPLPAVPSAMAHFADCILDGKPHTATGEEGLTVQRLLDAMYESADQGEPVGL